MISLIFRCLDHVDSTHTSICFLKFQNVELITYIAIDEHVVLCHDNLLGKPKNLFSSDTQSQIKYKAAYFKST